MFTTLSHSELSELIPLLRDAIQLSDWDPFLNHAYADAISELSRQRRDRKFAV